MASAATTFATGNRVAFASRELGNTSTTLDSITISAVPEPTAFTLLCIGALALAGWRRERR